MEEWDSVLQEACKNDDILSALKAIVYGCNLRIVKIEHPLLVAVSHGSLLCCVVLLLNGADANMKDNNSKSTKDIAKAYGFINIASYLQSKMSIPVASSSTVPNNFTPSTIESNTTTQHLPVSLTVPPPKTRRNSPTSQLYENMSKLVAGALSDKSTDEESGSTKSNENNTSRNINSSTSHPKIYRRTG
jgi:hypothetical protein